MGETGTFTFLGTGTSTGVPMIGCECAVCRSPNPRNQRYRCSVLVQTPTGNLLIDTAPELRLQLLRAGVRVVHAVLFTHFHADHLFGLDDVRPIPRHLGGPIPLYCTAEVEHVIRRTFSYAFPKPGEIDAAAAAFLPQLTLHRIGDGPFQAAGQTITPIPLIHDRFSVLGFRIGNLAYCTDVNRIPDSSWPHLENLDVLVLDALRLKPHPAHFSVDEALEVIAKTSPRRAYLTHMAHDIDYETISRQLPAGVELAYDNLSIPF
jgi:phosphoribosyl 1,2-cyclic phosphate phosphodiesterase